MDQLGSVAEQGSLTLLSTCEKLHWLEIKKKKKKVFFLRIEKILLLTLLSRKTL